VIEIFMYVTTCMLSGASCSTVTIPMASQMACIINAPQVLAAQVREQRYVKRWTCGDARVAKI
jgi:hypothetical protein